jgi:hypothetical protein
VIRSLNDQPRESDQNLTVLYIAGEGRSGSTILTTLLARDTTYCCVGELHGIWQALITNELCGCGQPFHECEFWRAVGAAGFGGWDEVDGSRMLMLSRSLTRQRHVGRLLIPALRERCRSELDRYTTILSTLYRAVSEVSGRSVIVDSSKGMPCALVLRQTPGLDLRLIHLIRDSRGVAYSWSKRGVQQPQYSRHPTLARTFMDRRGVWRSAIRWIVVNVAFDLLCRSDMPHIRLQYESFAGNPSVSVGRIMGLVGTETALPQSAPRVSRVASSQSDATPVPLNHSLGGNRVRFEQGEIRVRKDEEWRTRMPTRARLAVTVLSLPLLVMYGYIPGPRQEETLG